MEEPAFHEPEPHSGLQVQLLDLDLFDIAGNL